MLLESLAIHSTLYGHRLHHSSTSQADQLLWIFRLVVNKRQMFSQLHRGKCVTIHATFLAKIVSKLELEI